MKKINRGLPRLFLGVAMAGLLGTQRAVDVPLPAMLRALT
jgi:hypothetical protein